MVSKASELFPDPLTPVRTTSWFRGMRTETFLRLCTRASTTSMYPTSGVGVNSGEGESNSGILFKKKMELIWLRNRAYPVLRDERRI